MHISRTKSSQSIIRKILIQSCHKELYTMTNLFNNSLFNLNKISFCWKKSIKRMRSKTKKRLNWGCRLRRWNHKLLLLRSNCGKSSWNHNRRSKQNQTHKMCWSSCKIWEILMKNNFKNRSCISTKPSQVPSGEILLPSNSSDVRKIWLVERCWKKNWWIKGFDFTNKRIIFRTRLSRSKGSSRKMASFWRVPKKIKKRCIRNIELFLDRENRKSKRCKKMIKK